MLDRRTIIHQTNVEIFESLLYHRVENLTINVSLRNKNKCTRVLRYPSSLTMVMLNRSCPDNSWLKDDSKRIYNLKYNISCTVERKQVNRELKMFGHLRCENIKKRYYILIFVATSVEMMMTIGSQNIFLDHTGNITQLIFRLELKNGIRF